MTDKSNEMSEVDKVTQANQVDAKGIESNEAEEVKVASPDPSEDANDSSKNGTNEVPSKIIELSDNHQDQEESVNDESSEDESESEQLDLASLNKVQLLDLLKEKLKTNPVLTLDKFAHEIKSSFDDLVAKDKEEALSRFVEEGGLEDDFEYRLHDEDRAFNKVFGEFRFQLNQTRREVEKQKEKNLEIKTELLNQLRELVDGEETTLSMNAVKAIQEKWKSIGPVPVSQNRNLWASFNALMDRFYDNRSIYFELKELDRKKNLESKTELCEKAEALSQVKELKEAIKQLNELHEEFKHIGPVPREEQENLWQRFKAASDAVYDRRKEYFDSQKEVYKKNQEVKQELIVKLEPFAAYKADRIKDWNTKTKEILDLQKEWEKIGPVPKDVGKEINKGFWAIFKQFFHNKNQFFKELDEIRAANVKKAEELIAQAESLKDNTDWQNTANQLVKLQQEWKKLGPTPEKQRDALYKRFKNSCDLFFENRRNANKQSNSEFDANLKLKLDVLSKIKSASAGDSLSEEELTGLINEFNEIGFVPRKNMKEVQNQFKEVVDMYLQKLNPSGEDKDDFMFRLNLNRMQGDPNAAKNLNKKEHGIRKQIADLENNITLWKNNLEFFTASKTADKLRDQFDIKIQKAEEEVDKLKKKLSILREF